MNGVGGHYLAPDREYGFGSLDAIRSAFPHAPEPHLDLIPKDIGFGLHDSAYQKNTKKNA